MNIGHAYYVLPAANICKMWGGLKLAPSQMLSSWLEPLSHLPYHFRVKQGENGLVVRSGWKPEAPFWLESMSVPCTVCAPSLELLPLPSGVWVRALAALRASALLPLLWLCPVTVALQCPQPRRRL